MHDFNPGITQSGLFWTSIAALDQVAVSLTTGRATMEVRNLRMKDYFDVENATVGGGPPPVPGVVSYRVEWIAAGAINEFDNAEQQYRGQFRYAAAQMEWSARTTDYEFASAPIGTSITDAAQLGFERNGAFY